MRLLDKLPVWIRYPLLGFSTLLVFLGTLGVIAWVKDSHPLWIAGAFLAVVVYGISWGVGLIVSQMWFDRPSKW